MTGLLPEPPRVTMTIHFTDDEVKSHWQALTRRMRRAAWAAVAILLLLGLLVFFLLVPRYWTPWVEGLWSTAVGLMTLVLLVTQWRLASFRCPRCGGSWFERRWFLSNPFGLYRTHCANCRMEKGALRWEPWE
jgi:hypothetical protein